MLDVIALFRSLAGSITPVLVRPAFNTMISSPSPKLSVFRYQLMPISYVQGIVIMYLIHGM